MPHNYTPKEIDRFWAKVEVTDTCWYWTGGTNRSGYGNAWIGGTNRIAPRVAYELAYGDIPPGLVVRHACDQPPCVRPDHLFLGTTAENNAERAAKGRNRRYDGAPGLRGVLDSLLQRIRRKPTPEDRFWAKVDRSGDCWLWTAGRDKLGYGWLTANGVRDSAHRTAYRYTYGEIPPGMYICHRCDNPPCVNPDHLFLGTPTDNVRDKQAKGRQPAGDRHHNRIRPERMERGENRWNAKLTPDLIREIRYRYAMETANCSRLAEEYGLKPGTVRDIVNRKIWKHIE